MREDGGRAATHRILSRQPAVVGGRVQQVREVPRGQFGAVGEVVGTWVGSPGVSAPRRDAACPPVHAALSGGQQRREEGVRHLAQAEAPTALAVAHLLLVARRVDARLVAGAGERDTHAAFGPRRTRQWEGSLLQDPVGRKRHDDAAQELVKGHRILVIHAHLQLQSLARQGCSEGHNLRPISTQIDHEVHLPCWIELVVHDAAAPLQTVARKRLVGPRGPNRPDSRHAVGIGLPTPRHKVRIAQASGSMDAYPLRYGQLISIR
mmetsp:Transcript_28932/g.64958  ORF Transcript_28932/g.64958 Transcript_28932/m.64958 type:complete len:264 (-) Transcript_28932:26-817(-)